MAKANPFRFSTKYQDDETDLLYYGYRYYNASTGRWPTRDPMTEQGGRGLYVFALNDPSHHPDILGLSPLQVAGGIVGSIQLSYVVCEGNVTLNGWVWMGLGYEWNDRFVGYSAYYQGNPIITWPVPPLINCGKCSPCCNSGDASGFQRAVGVFKGGLIKVAGIPLEL